MQNVTCVEAKQLLYFSSFIAHLADARIIQHLKQFKQGKLLFLFTYYFLFVVTKCCLSECVFRYLDYIQIY